MQLLKASDSISRILSGSEISFIALQFIKAEEGIFSIFSGILMLSSKEQLANDDVPSVSTDSGRVTLAREMQFEKA